MHYTLLAIAPFDEVEKAVLALRIALFQATGFASTQALPPLFPLCWLPPDLKLNAMREVLAANKVAWQYTFTGIREQHGVLYWAGHEQAAAPGIESLVTKLLAVRRKPCTNDTVVPALFPVVNGFFLAMKEAELNPELVKNSERAPLGMRSFRLAIMRITVHAPLDCWWKNVEWELGAAVKSDKSSCSA